MDIKWCKICVNFPCFIENTVLAATTNEILAISVDDNGFEVDDQGFHRLPSNVSLDEAYSFQLNGIHMLCIGTSLYQYDTCKKMWSKLSYEMDKRRIGAACISVGKNVLIAGGLCQS